jgi:hypothetical protein
MSNPLMIAIVAGVMSFAMVKIVVPSPSLTQYKADVTRLENDLVTIRAKYALVTDVPNVNALNTRIATVETAIGQANSEIETARAELQTNIDAIKFTPFDASELQADIDKNTVAITALTAELADLKEQIGDIPSDDLSGDLTALNTRLTALETSVKNLVDNVIPDIVESIATIKLPGVYVNSLSYQPTGTQLAVTSDTVRWVLVTVKYTYVVAPITAPVPPLMLYSTGFAQTQSYPITSGANTIQIVWILRGYVNAGSNTITWAQPAGLVGGTWSASVEVSQ